MVLTRKEVQERLCKLATAVRDAKFDLSMTPSDCFCDKNGLMNDFNYQFDAGVLEFMERAVYEKLDKKTEEHLDSRRDQER